MGVLGKWPYAARCNAGGLAPSPVQRGAGLLPGAAARLESGNVQFWGGGDAEGPCLVPGMVGKDQVVGAEPLQSGKGPAGKQQEGGSGHGQDAGE